MPLETIKLDDLTWVDLTTAARDRIPGASRGQWTLHAPVDPGITLLELFASQLEQRLYWMDQPSDELEEALLGLHGECARPVQCAKTVLCFQMPNDTYANCVELKRHTVATCSIADTAKRFRTIHGISLFPLRCDQPIKTGSQRQPRIVSQFAVELEHEIDGQPVVQELKAKNKNHLIHLLPAIQARAVSRIRFPFCRNATAHGWQTSKDKAAILSIFIELDVAATVRPQWRRESSSTKVAPPTRVQWQLNLVSGSGVNQTKHPVTIERYSDGTNGLRNSGIIRFRIRNCRIEQGNQRWYLELTVTANTRDYTFAPIVKQIIPNAVIAEHRQSHKQTFAPTKTGVPIQRLPGNRIDLDLDIDDSLITDKTLRLAIEEKPLGARRPKSFYWCMQTSLAQASPQSRVFLADRDRNRIVFGDGINGRIPRPVKDSKIHVFFDVGGGEAGNVAGPNVWVSQVGELHLKAMNVVPASGGLKAETVEQAAQRLRTELRSVGRAVTRQDIEAVAIATPDVGVARAWAAIGLHPMFPTLTTPGAASVFVVPDLPQSMKDSLAHTASEDNPSLRLDRLAMNTVSHWLDGKRLLTHEIFVCQPEYEEIDLSITLQGNPLEKAQVDSLIRSALRIYLHPLLGGPDQKGWPFGGAIRPSELLRQIDQLVAPELNVTSVGVHKRTSEGVTGSSCEARQSQPNGAMSFNTCTDTAIGKNSLVALRTIRVRYSDDRQTGGLQ